jgi:hypothetical protein
MEQKRHRDSPPYKQPSVEEVHVRSPAQQDTVTRGIKVRVRADVDREGEPGSNGSEGITGVGVRKVIDLAFEKNLMRANAVDCKNSSVGVVDFSKPELVPVLMVMNHAKGAMPGAGASMTAAGAT